MLRRTSRRRRVASPRESRLRGAAAVRLEARCRRDRFLGVVADEERFDHEVRLHRRCIDAKQQQFLDRSVSLHAAVDDAIALAPIAPR